MTGRIKRFVLIFVLCVFSGLLGNSPWARGAALNQANTPGQETEPNHRFDLATPIAVTGSIQAAITPAADADWYVLMADHQGELQLTIRDVGANAAIDVRVWNANKDVIADWLKPLAPGGDTSGIVDLPEPGRYYLEVVADSGTTTSGDAPPQPYTLQTGFTPTADSAEPNNTFGAATPLNLGAPLQANLLPQGDADWYSLTVKQQGELQVVISNVAAELAIAVRVWNANKDVISDWVSPQAKGGDTRAMVDLPTPGRYLLEVVENNGQRSSQPYTLQTTFTPAVDPYEPNNNFASATPLQFGKPVQVNLLPQNDADWFSLDANGHGELNVAITTAPPDLAVDFRVWNANKDVLHDWLKPLAKGGDNRQSVDLPEPGRYYLEVVEDSGARAIQPFSLTLAFTRAVDPFEPNNSFGKASSLALDQAVQTNILPQGDSDWHVFEVTHQGELHIGVSALPANLTVDVRVWNGNKEVVNDWLKPLTKGGDTNGVVDLPAPGRYYLEVADDSGRERSIQPFTLQTKFVATADQGEPNDTIDTAAPVNLDTTIPANILPVNDADWCRLEITSTGELHVLITNAPPGMALAMRLWNDQQQVLSDWQQPLAAGGDTTGVFPIEKPGVYFLEVVDNNRSRSIQPYLLRFSMQPIDPATLAFTSTLTNTTTLTDTTAVTTTTTTIITIITTTVTATGAQTTTQVVTTTQTLTSTDIATRTLGTTGTVTTTVNVTNTLSLSTTDKVTIRVSGQVGPQGGTLFVQEPGDPTADGARLDVPAEATAELITLHLGTTATAPPHSPFGLFPAGAYWVLTPAGQQFQKPVTLTLPIPLGVAGAKQFIGHWNGKEWQDLGGVAKDGLIQAATNSFSTFAVFCDSLTAHRQVTIQNDASSPYLVLTFMAGPSPDPDHLEEFVAGCPAPSTAPLQAELRQGESAQLLLRPGRYHFRVAYPQPQPGVANDLDITIHPGADAQTIRVEDSGAKSSDPSTEITFAGNTLTAGSNQRPIIACNATVPAGISLANGDPAAIALPSRVVLIGDMKLEQWKTGQPGVSFSAVATDPEGGKLRPFWTVSWPSGKGLPVAGAPVDSAASIPAAIAFQPSSAGRYILFLTVYDSLGLFDECRWEVSVQPNARPEIAVVTGRTAIQFGRLDEDRTVGVGAIAPITVTAPASIPSLIDPSTAVSWDGLTLCPSALTGPFATLPDPNTIVLAPTPVDALAPKLANDATNRWVNPGETCVWTLVADADLDPQAVQFEFPGPIFGSGTFFAAVAVPAAFHPDLPGGMPLGALIRTAEQLRAYNAWVSAVYNLLGVVPALVWEAWDDPCAPGAGAVANPCPSAISRGGVENMVANTTDGFALPPRTGYAPVRVGPDSFLPDCNAVIFFASLTPSPSDPAPNQGIVVTARLSDWVEACPVRIRVVGTDGFNNDQVIPTNKSGEAALFIPGGAEGVVDVVTAEITQPDGSVIRIEVTYTF